MSQRESLSPLFNIENLRESLQAGCTVITSNLRLSRKIREAWHRDRCNREIAAWKEPTILPLESWLESCWLDLLDTAYPAALTGHCLSRHQESFLWQQVIQSDQELPPELNPDNFADLAQRGWKLVKQWQLDEKVLSPTQHAGARFLFRWGTALEKTLHSRSLISPEQRTNIVLQGFEQKALPRQPVIVLVGFQTLPPLYLALLNLATDKLVHHQPTSVASTCYQLSAEDTGHEIAHAAFWARDRVSESREVRVGVVIPGLTALQCQVERIFCNVLAPDSTLPSSGYKPAPFNISAACPISEAPVVSAALKLLSLLRPELPVQDFCELLNSPFWGAADKETEIRCVAQKALLALGLHRYPPGRFRQLLHSLESDEEDCAGDSSLSYRLSRVATLQRQLPAKSSFAQWQEIFTQVLDVLGWPGTRSPDSLEYQQLEHWHNLVSTLGELDQVSTPVNAAQALGQLSELAASSPFHAENPDSQIQILGTLEAAGLSFDYLWVMNMEDRRWPEATSPHPLLPAAVQKQFGMPRANPEKELELSRQLFELFSTSAKEVVFSYSRREGDITLKPSVFLANIAETRTTSVDTLHPWWPVLLQSGELEIVEDSFGPAYNSQDHKLAGGSRFLADQAQCPFNAFARWRLGAEPLPEPETGLSPAWRGILVHSSMERFWRDISNSQTLKDLSIPQRQQYLEYAIRGAMHSLFRQQAGLIIEADIGHRLLELERCRLGKLLSSWLSLENERQPFQVAHSELRTELTLGGYLLNLRLDRVDRLEEGELAIIDYKTGRAGIGVLTGERLLETQLPLYALAMKASTGETPAVVCYARINLRKMGFDGLAEQSDLLQNCRELASIGLPETWDETLAAWHSSLEQIAVEIQQGCAEVAFYSGDAFRYGSDLIPLNRWPDLVRLDRYRKSSQVSRGAG